MLCNPWNNAEKVFKKTRICFHLFLPQDTQLDLPKVFFSYTSCPVFEMICWSTNFKKGLNFKTHGGWWNNNLKNGWLNCARSNTSFLKMYKFQAYRKNLEVTYEVNLSQIQSALSYQDHQEIRFKVKHKHNQELTATCAELKKSFTAQFSLTFWSHSQTESSIQTTLLPCLLWPQEFQFFQDQ